jgi:putative sterol carrier protein
MPTLAKITAAMAEREVYLPDKRVKLDFGDDGVILLDGVARQVSTMDGDADTTLKLTLENFVAMAEGRLSGTMAFMQGKLKISGDMATAMQFQSVTSKMRADR